MSLSKELDLGFPLGFTLNKNQCITYAELHFKLVLACNVGAFDQCLERIRKYKHLRSRGELWVGMWQVCVGVRGVGVSYGWVCGRLCLQ